MVDYGYKEGLVYLYVIGGGGCLLRHYSDIASKRNVTFIEDICSEREAYGTVPKSFYLVLSPKVNDGGFFAGMSSLSDSFSERLRMPLGRRGLPLANTTLGERLTSDAYVSEVIRRYF